MQGAGGFRKNWGGQQLVWGKRCLSPGTCQGQVWEAWSPDGMSVRAAVCVSARACDCEKVRKEGAKGGELRTSGGKGVGEQGKGGECVRGEEEGQSWGEG